MVLVPCVSSSPCRCYSMIVALPCHADLFFTGFLDILKSIYGYFKPDFILGYP